MLRHGRLTSLPRTVIATTLPQRTAKRYASAYATMQAAEAKAAAVIQHAIQNAHNPYSHASTAHVRVSAAILKLPSIPGSKVDLSSEVTRSQAAQQIVLALLHKKEQEDAKLREEGETFVIPGMSSKEIYDRSEIEFPEKPFPAPAERPVRLGKGKRVMQQPPSQPRPGHAIHSTSYLKQVVMPDLVARNLVRKAHYQRPPATELEVQRLYARAKKLAKRAATKGKTAVPSEELQEAERTLRTTQVVDVWRWELVPENERIAAEQRRLKRLEERQTQAMRLRADGRPEVAPYGPSRLDHLNDRRKAQRVAEERMQMLETRSAVVGLTAEGRDPNSGIPPQPRLHVADKASFSPGTFSAPGGMTRLSGGIGAVRERELPTGPRDKKRVPGEVMGGLPDSRTLKEERHTAKRRERIERLEAFKHRRD